MFLFSFARAGEMIGHRFSDDVAVCYALTKKQAIKKFSRLYADIKPNEVTREPVLRRGVAILTDY